MALYKAQFVESRLSNVELGGVNGVKRGKSHQSITAAQPAVETVLMIICIVVYIKDINSSNN